MAPTACVDASLVIRQVAGPDESAVHEIWASWAEAEAQLVAPALLMYEVTSVLYRMQRLGVLNAAAAAAALRAAAALPVRTLHDAAVHREAFDVALRFGLGAAYDAHYLAVAEREGTALWTADARLVRGVGERGAHLVRLVASG
jgi:predicted nucleic acid-binding protein